ncbi:hypothetical protein HDV00_012658, partial [Rhizophlyctis rosea]
MPSQHQDIHATCTPTPLHTKHLTTLEATITSLRADNASLISQLTTASTNLSHQQQRYTTLWN